MCDDRNDATLEQTPEFSDCLIHDDQMEYRALQAQLTRSSRISIVVVLLVEEKYGE
jgi:hypothetical protein